MENNLTNSKNSVFSFLYFLSFPSSLSSSFPLLYFSRMGFPVVSGYPPSGYVAKDNPSAPPYSSPERWEYKYVLPHPVSAVLAKEPRTLCMRGYAFYLLSQISRGTEWVFDECIMN